MPSPNQTRRWKYRAWIINDLGDPQESCEEEFRTHAKDHTAVLATAYRRAAKALMPNLSRRESLWVETVYEVKESADEQRPTATCGK